MSEMTASYVASVIPHQPCLEGLEAILQVLRTQLAQLAQLAAHS
jgi:hypothetical protein